MRKILEALGWAAAGAFALGLGLYIVNARSMPDLAPWHAPLLKEEFPAEEAGESFGKYIAREGRLFRALEEDVRERGPTRAAAELSRFNADSPNNPANYSRNWNRSFVFPASDPAGGVLLVHGLSDSPYSMRAVAEIFRARGFYVVGLRLPGHGTLPGALLRASWRDWRAAVRMGARYLAREVGPQKPLIMAGYSNGAALLVDYALGASEGSSDPAPSRLLLLSPALAVRPIAALARVQRLLAVLPGLHKLAWTEILPEYDPYKYNSFPVYAGEQIYGLTAQLRRRIERLAARKAPRRIPGHAGVPVGCRRDRPRRVTWSIGCSGGSRRTTRSSFSSTLIGLPGPSPCCAADTTLSFALSSRTMSFPLRSHWSRTRDRTLRPSSLARVEL